MAGGNTGLGTRRPGQWMPRKTEPPFLWDVLSLGSFSEGTLATTRVDLGTQAIGYASGNQFTLVAVNLAGAADGSSRHNSLAWPSPAVPHLVHPFLAIPGADHWWRQP